MKFRKHEAPSAPPKYPGIPTALDGSAAVVEMETAASDAAGAYPITPSTQMGEGWAAPLAARTANLNPTHPLTAPAGHDDYPAVDDAGFFQLFAKNVQESADLTLCAHRIAELSLNPGLCAQDGFLTSHVIEMLQLPDSE